MPLYAADVSKLAKPVSKSVQKVHDISTNQQETVRKPKRQLSETQKENLKKGRDALAMKKEVVEEDVKQKKTKRVKVEKEVVEPDVVEPEKPKKSRKKIVKEIIEEVKEEEEEEEEVKEVKEEKKRKRKPKTIADITPEPEPVEEPKIKKIKVQRDPSVPPLWFEKYIQGVKKEEAMVKTEKVPAKQVKIEAQEVAQKSWDDGLTRDRVTNEVDNHMNRMYSMIFSRR